MSNWKSARPWADAGQRTGWIRQDLLAEWARTTGRSVAWISLDARDNDPWRFWRYIAVAVNCVLPGLAGRMEPLLNSSAQPTPETVVPVLIDGLLTRAQDGQIVLVLDDYHVLWSQAIHDSLALLLDRRPPSLAVVLASRSDPPLPLHDCGRGSSSPRCVLRNCVSPPRRPAH